MGLSARGYGNFVRAAPGDKGTERGNPTFAMHRILVGYCRMRDGLRTGCRDTFSAALKDGPPPHGVVPRSIFYPKVY